MAQSVPMSAAPAHDFTVPSVDLLALEEKVVRAIATADESGLDVLGYGEVTLVLRLKQAQGDLACKRLPIFPTADRFARYEETLREYLARLGQAGVNAAPTQVWTTSASNGVAAYLVQRILPPERLASRWLSTASEEQALRFFDQLLVHLRAAVTPTFGLDAQASNWIVEGDGTKLTYLDVTTPLMRDAAGNERLDVKLFFTSLPWALRDLVRVTMSKSIFEKFYSVRGVVLDFLGNLHKERLERFVPPFLERVNAGLDQPLAEAEVKAYYDEDAKMWALIQKLRHADRWWQRAVRRRPYPFLLPRSIER